MVEQLQKLGKSFSKLEFFDPYFWNRYFLNIDSIISLKNVYYTQFTFDQLERNLEKIKNEKII